MSETSSRERLLTALRHQEPDRVPINVHVQPPGDGLFYGPGYPAWRNKFDALETLVELDTDPTVDIWLPEPVVHADVSIRDGRYRTADGGSVLFKEYDTPKGTLRMEVNETEDWRGYEHRHWQPQPWGRDRREHWYLTLFDDWNTSRLVRPLVSSIDDLEKLTYLLNAPSGFDLQEWQDYAAFCKSFAQQHGLLLRARRSFAGDAALWLCDTSDFLMKSVEEPDFCREFLRIVQEWSLKTLELGLEVGVDMADRRGWYEVPAIFGVDAWQRLLAPLIDEAGRMVHEAGVLHCYMHTEGNLDLAQQLNAAEIDVIWGMDPSMGDDDPVLSKEAFRDRIAVMGGISDCLVLQKASPKKIREEVARIISIMAPGGGFVLMPVHSVAPQTPWEAFRAFIDAGREFGKYH